jgi:hypothetical protein
MRPVLSPRQIIDRKRMQAVALMFGGAGLMLIGLITFLVGFLLVAARH